MIRLSEAEAKTWLRESGLPVPWGMAASDAAAAAASVAEHAGPAVVKAMVATGRRGKAGAVLMADDGAARGAAAASLLGREVNGFRTAAVYVEQRIAITAEYYFAVVLDGASPEVLISCAGGVEIEEVAHSRPEAVLRAPIDPLTGLTAATASALWQRAGAPAAALARLAELSVGLYAAFVRADGLMLEINPLALDAAGQPWLVGAMLGVDPAALGRHPQWRASGEALPDNPRERAVVLANREGAGECQYNELDGDIGLLVGGGGAGLYLHDLILEFGGAPANHCVTPPTSADNRKLKAVLEAIFDNPRVRGVLVGFNFAQMARTDIRTRTLVEVLDAKQIDTSRLPVVIRLFGAGEADSRQMVAGRPNVHYVPRGTTLKEAAQLIVRLTAAARAAQEAR